MKHPNTTILDVFPSGPQHVFVRFRRRGRGSRNWQFIVDGFAEILAAARKERGIDWSLPEQGRSLGRGLRLKIGRKMYGRVRAAFQELEEVAEALADGSFVIDDGWLFSESDDEAESREDAS